jgi:hypothetical protein
MTKNSEKNQILHFKIPSLLRVPFLDLLFQLKFTSAAHHPLDDRYYSVVDELQLS